MPDEAHRAVHYVIDAFRTSPDFRLAPIARFRFTRPDRSKFRVAADGQLLPERDFQVVDRRATQPPGRMRTRRPSTLKRPAA